MSDWVTNMGGIALGSRFRRLGDHLSSEVKVVYKKLDLDLNPRNLPVMSLLYSSEYRHGLSVTEMAKELQLTHIAVSHMVKLLEVQGYCKKRPYQRDQRVTHIFLTEKAEKLIEETLLNVWKVIGEVTEERLMKTQGNFWETIQQAETQLSNPPLSSEILSRLS